MSIIERETYSTESLDGQRNIYADLEQLTPDTFRDNADDIFASVRNNPGDRRKVREAYINDAEDETLRLQGEVILDAPMAVRIQSELDGLHGRIQHLKRDQEGLNPAESAELDQLKAEVREKKRLAINYDHKVRDLISENSDGVEHDNLLNWLERGSGGNRVWAEKLVAGVAGEIAIARVLKNKRGVRSVRFSSEEEDLVGADVIFKDIAGKDVAIDTKIGRGNICESRWRPSSHFGKVLEFEIGKDSLDDFEVMHGYVPVVEAEIDKSMDQDT